MKRPTIAEKRRAFRALHERGCFVLPNPWDIGSARLLQKLGFKALATTSAGFAFSIGRPDYGLMRDAVLAHLREMAAATDLPLNADFENGFADKPEEVAENARLCVETGVAGLSIEDSTGDADAPLYCLEHAVARIAAARQAIDQVDREVMLVARTECYLVDVEEIEEVKRRLVAFAAAGADCLYAPGISTREEITAVVQAVAPKPVNLLLTSPGGLTLRDAAELGVRRVSVGGALQRAAMGGFLRAATALAEEGSFEGFAGATPHGELQEFFRADAPRRDA